MTFVFVSNYMSIHQLPLADALYALLGNNFTFVSTTPMDPDRKEMGFEEYADRPYIVLAYGSPEMEAVALQRINDCDVLLLGSAPEHFVDARLRSGKLCLKYSERFFKGGSTVKERFKFWCSALRHIKPLEKCNLYFLCASAYTAQDVNRYADFSDRCFRWGYFREILPVAPEKLVAEKKKHSLIWTGRLIDWKHPELAVQLAGMLRDAGIDFELNMIGNGDMHNALTEMVKQARLDKYVHLLGAQSPETVKQYMDAAQIALATSDHKEGWGVVINEAMNSCCAVVASHAMGSVPYLIEDGKTGIIFESGNVQSLYAGVMRLLSDEQACSHMGMAAYRSLSELWNAELAAKRILELSRSLVERRELPTYLSGPCSKAPALENDWIRKR